MIELKAVQVDPEELAYALAGLPFEDLVNLILLLLKSHSPSNLRDTLYEKLTEVIEEG